MTDSADESASLRLSIDVSAVPARAAGAGQYTIALVRALAVRPDVDMMVVSRRDDAARWESVTGGKGVVPAAPGPRPLRLAWEQARLAAVVRQLDRSVHHGPHYTMPERARLPAVVTVHDLSFFTDPRWHERTKAVLFRRAIRVASRRAAAIVCPSATTAAELARWSPATGRVFVAHHGVDADRFSSSEPMPGSDAAALAATDRRLVSGRPFVLFVGTLEPRKDVPTLVHAFAGIAARHPDTLLVLAGGRGWGADAVDRAVESAGITERVVQTGYVDDDLVPALLRSATVAAYPARYEGFGLPALEALSCGTPVVTTVGTAMAEVTGSAAVLVPAGDVDALADALDGELGSRSPAHGDRRRQGFLVAGRHTWAASAARHLEAYRYAVSQGGRPRVVPHPTR